MVSLCALFDPIRCFQVPTPDGRGKHVQHAQQRLLSFKQGWFRVATLLYSSQAVLNL